MCIGGGASPVSSAPKDTSNEPIKSAYELPPELVESERQKAKNRAKSLVQFDQSGEPPRETSGYKFGGSRERMDTSFIG